jgi:uracil-DNA glycosylase
MPRGPSLDALLADARACTACAAHLPHGPRPVLQAGPGSRIVIVGQAPGAKVHACGVPWQDRSGDHLLEWLEVDRPTFEDPSRFAILPMGFCWPGRRAGGDLPPRPECAPLWHERLLARMPRVRLTLLVGQYAQQRYLGDRAKDSLTENVRSFEEFAPALFPLPHPSWRSRIWMKQNPWFAKRVLPALRKAVRDALSG